MESTQALLRLLQLTSPALPIGAYSYSEGLETLVQNGTITNPVTLEHWLAQELQYGAIRLELAVLFRIHQAIQTNNPNQIQYWNQWLSAFRETEELRQQSWQMGRSLTRLLNSLEPGWHSIFEAIDDPCHFTTAFAVAAVQGQIEVHPAALGYLYSWVANLINAAIRLVPLGQTQGQQLLLKLYPQLEQTVEQVADLQDDDLWSCNWGLTIASMNHETLYSRLFRS